MKAIKEKAVCKRKASELRSDFRQVVNQVPNSTTITHERHAFWSITFAGFVGEESERERVSESQSEAPKINLLAALARHFPVEIKNAY